MSSKDLKRLDLRLPPNHPIFSFDVEPRQRAKIARGWLDNGVRIAGLEFRMSILEKQLADIKVILTNGTFEAVQKPEPSPAKTGIDLKAFKGAICDL